MTPTDDSALWAARRERARRWIAGGNHNLHGYPALHADEETEETLGATPPEREGKKKVQPSEQSS
jgi:hypothetical protein